MKYKILLIFGIGLLILGCKTTTPQKPNILLLYMDDLRPQLNCYGQTQMQTPNIDNLAKQGVLFNNAYCNVAVCGASRASMLTGMRPTKNIFRDYKVFVQDDTPNAITLPQLFKQNGYTTISNGKIYHHLDDRVSDWDEVWRPYAFEENPDGLAPTDWWEGLWRDYLLPENILIYQATNSGPAYERADVRDTDYIDGLMTQKVINDIEKFKNNKEPFFLTAGFISPHLPFNAPARHWDKYPSNSIKQPYNNFVAKNAPEISISKSIELRQYTGIPDRGQKVNDSTAISLIHGYYATVSYVDTLIGDILNKLKSSGLDKNTIIVFVSDHGYNLQEHSQWAKWTSHRISMQIPLIISSPFISTSGNTNALVELVDIYPTIAQLCDIEIPNKQLEGKSLAPILHNPNLEGKSHIFINNTNGYTIKTQKYSYTEYINPINNKLIDRMLYDHDKDPDENENVVETAEYAKIVDDLHKELHSSYYANIYGE
ncbi:Arylsulfatase A [Lutibacter agarilyticus]|uniref:Arylsulfatase A n=1 Tax=Lutibacter agarilyticus TaxID=1109740 RepID=A0A238Z4R2_9FLAO|nr:sulfatase [Lutibacter agarilyticus]SNR78326.1 Arylsulfatase A [Lutibacter agarilyticus]